MKPKRFLPILLLCGCVAKSVPLPRPASVVPTELLIIRNGQQIYLQWPCHTNDMWLMEWSTNAGLEWHRTSNEQFYPEHCITEISADPAQQLWIRATRQ